MVSLSLHPFHLITVFLLCDYYYKALGVGCDKSEDCVKTNYTRAVCERGECLCERPYRPIETGCGERLYKPTVAFDNQPNQVVWAYENTRVSLRCHTSNVQPESRRIIWKFGYKQLAVTSDNYVFDISKTSVASAYTCAVAPSSLEDTALTSEFSEPFKITMIRANALPGGEWKPVLDVIRKSSATYQKLPLSCANLPVGIESVAKIEYFRNSSSTSVSKDFTFTGNVTLHCKVSLKDDPAKSVQSDKVGVTQTHNIDGVVVSISGYPPNVHNLTVKRDQRVELICTDDGTVAVLPIAIGFFWKANGTAFDAPYLNDKIFINTSVVGTTNYKCEGAIGYNTLRESVTISIIVEDEPLPVPVIKLSPEQPSPESHISLTCGEFVSSEVKYFWIKNNLAILGQHDRVIQLHDIGMVMDKYKCLAVKNGYRIDSPEINTSVKPNQPSLTVENGPKEYSLGASYTLKCKTSPESDQVIYKYMCDTTVLNGTSSVYNLTDVTSSDNGTYTCLAHFGDVSSEGSEGITITVGAAGKYCESKADCKGKQYTRHCTDNRCVCTSGYKKKGDNCLKSSSTALKVSILGLLISVLFSGLGLS